MLTKQNHYQQLLSFLNSTHPYPSVMNLIDQCCKVNDVDSSHGLQHAIDIAGHVYRSILSILQENGQINEQSKQALMLAALLHDVDDRKYFNSLNYDNARNILSKIPQKQLICQKDIVIKMIDLVSFSKNGNKILSQLPEWYYIPRYADRLDAIGLIGLWRCYEYSFRVKNPFFIENTAKPLTKQQLSSIIQGRDQIYMSKGGRSDSVIDHMFDKILHIKLPIHNKYLQCLYQEGHDVIVQFVIEHAKSNYQNAEEDLIRICKDIKQ